MKQIINIWLLLYVSTITLYSFNVCTSLDDLFGSLADSDSNSESPNSDSGSSGSSISESLSSESSPSWDWNDMISSHSHSLSDSFHNLDAAYQMLHPDFNLVNLIPIPFDNDCAGTGYDPCHSTGAGSTLIILDPYPYGYWGHATYHDDLPTSPRNSYQQQQQQKPNQNLPNYHASIATSNSGIESPCEKDLKCPYFIDKFAIPPAFELRCSQKTAWKIEAFDYVGEGYPNFRYYSKQLIDELSHVSMFSFTPKDFPKIMKTDIAGKHQHLQITSESYYDTGYFFKDETSQHRLKSFWTLDQLWKHFQNYWITCAFQNDFKNPKIGVPVAPMFFFKSYPPTDTQKATLDAFNQYVHGIAEHQRSVQFAGLADHTKEKKLGGLKLAWVGVDSSDGFQHKDTIIAPPFVMHFVVLNVAEYFARHRVSYALEIGQSLSLLFASSEYKLYDYHSYLQATINNNLMFDHNIKRQLYEKYVTPSLNKISATTKQSRFKANCIIFSENIIHFYNVFYFPCYYETPSAGFDEKQAKYDEFDGARRERYAQCVLNAFDNAQDWILRNIPPVPQSEQRPQKMKWEIVREKVVEIAKQPAANKV